MLKNIARHCLLGVVLLLVPQLALADEQGAYRQYLDYCLGTSGNREICECTFKKSREVLSADEIEAVASNLRSRRPADSTALQKINNSTASCKKETAERDEIESTQAPALTPPPPLNIPAPPPLPGNIEKEEKKKEKPAETIDISESNFLSQIKQKREALPEPPVNPEYGIDTTSAPRNKSAKFKPEPKKAYFGQYNELYFTAAANGNLKALYAITPNLDTVDIRTPAGDTPLMIATQYGQEAVIKYLLSQKADVNAVNYKKQTTLHIASFTHRTDLAQLLLTAGADINASYSGGYTPLMLAITAQDSAMIKWLAESGATLAPLENGDTPLHVAAMTNNPNIIWQVTSLSGGLEGKNSAGETALMTAAKNNLATAVIKLLELGADINAVDASGHNAYQIAAAAGAQTSVNAILTFVQRGQ